MATVSERFTLESTIYVNALVWARAAIEQPSEVRVAVLFAPAAAASALEQARQALIALAHQPTALPGVPQIYEAGADENDLSYLVIGPLCGAPARQQLLRGEGLPEATLVTFAQRHLRLLDAMHTQGYNGLSLTPDMLWLDPESGEFTLLGWEWLVNTGEQGPHDLRAAAAFFYELTTGLPPLTAIQAEQGAAAWLGLSLSWRRFCVQLWRGDLTITTALAELVQLEQGLTEPLDALLARAQTLDSGQTHAIAMLADLATRRGATAEQLAPLRSRMETAPDQPLEPFLRKGQHLITLGRYSEAETLFAQIYQAPNASDGLRLQTQRWRQVANALAEAVAANLYRYQRSAREIEPPLCDLLHLTTTGDYAAAEQRLAILRSGLPTEVELTALTRLHDDLRFHASWQRAQTMETAGQYELAFQTQQEALTILKGLPYRNDVLAVVGELEEAIGRVRIAQQQQEQAERLLAYANEYMAAEQFDEAAQTAQQAVRLLPARSAQGTECRQLMMLALASVQANAAGFAIDPTRLTPGQQWLGLAALAELQRQFPTAPWPQHQRQRWQAVLLEAMRSSPDAALARLLTTTWPEDEAVHMTLQQASDQLVLQSRAQVEALAQDLQRQLRPSVLPLIQQQLITLQSALTAHMGWIRMTTAQEALPILQKHVEELLSLAAHKEAQFQNLRQRLVAAQVQDQPVTAILEEAKQAQVELYDEPERSLAMLDTLTARAEEVQQTPSWRYALRSGLAAWELGETQIARAALEIVVAQREATSEGRATARAVLAAVDKGRPPSAEMLTTLLDAVRAELATARPPAAPTRLTAAPRSAAPKQPRRRRRWWPTILTGALVVIVIVALALFGGDILGRVGKEIAQRLSSFSRQLSELRPPKQQSGAVVDGFTTSVTPTFTVTATATSPPTATPEPTNTATPRLVSPTLRVEPVKLDVGIGATMTLQVRLANAVGSSQVDPQTLRVSVTPSELLTVTLVKEGTGYVVVTDAQGRAAIPLAARLVGEGKVAVETQGVDGTDTWRAPVLVRPVVTPLTSLNIRSGPDTTYAAVGAVRPGSRLPILGRSTGVGWWFVRLADGATGWVTTGTRFVTVSGDTAGVPIRREPLSTPAVSVITPGAERRSVDDTR